MNTNAIFLFFAFDICREVCKRWETSNIDNGFGVIDDDLHTPRIHSSWYARYAMYVYGCFIHLTLFTCIVCSRLVLHIKLQCRFMRRPNFILCALTVIECGELCRKLGWSYIWIRCNHHTNVCLQTASKTRWAFYHRHFLFILVLCSSLELPFIFSFARAWDKYILCKTNRAEPASLLSHTIYRLGGYMRQQTETHGKESQTMSSRS